MYADEYEIREFGSVQAFLNHCLDWLLENCVANNSLIAVVQAIDAGKPGFGGSYWFGSVLKDGAIQGCAIYEELDGLMTTRLPTGVHQLVADSVGADGLQVNKVYGPKHDSEQLARALCKDETRSWTVTHRWDCYAAQEIQWPASTANGELRKTTDNEKATIEAWAEQYAEEKPAPIPVKDFFLRKMQDGDLYVWDDSGAKTMLTVSGRTPLCARISAAFTPLEFRGRGYASSAVATLTSKLLDQGHRYTTLMVESDEDHLHRMYQRLGFEKRDSTSNIALTDADSLSVTNS